jgi:hypothetical protein
MDLGRVEGHRQHPVRPCRVQQICHEAAADRDPGRLLLVRPGVRVVRDDRRDPGRRGAAGCIQHQHQLHQVLLHRRAERLDDVDILLAAVGLELHLEAVVAEAADIGLVQGQAQRRANLGGQLGMRAPAEDADASHGGGCLSWRE